MTDFTILGGKAMPSQCWKKSSYFENSNLEQTEVRVYVINEFHRALGKLDVFRQTELLSDRGPGAS